MMPRNDQFHELMTNVSDWSETALSIDVLGFADSILDIFSDAELTESFAAMRKYNIPLAFEVGAIKEWGWELNPQGHGTYYGVKMFDNLKPRIDKAIALGADVRVIAFDEPIANLLNTSFDPSVWGWIGDDDAKVDFAIAETTILIRKLREEYPGILIGDIGTYPFADNYFEYWLDAMKDEIDFYRLDVDWNHFTDAKRPDVYPTEDIGWQEVKVIEEYCRSIGMPFSLIYWSPEEGKYLGPDGYYDESRDRDAADEVWYNQVTHQFEQYKAVGGSPDQYVIQTWTRVKIQEQEIDKDTGLPKVDGSGNPVWKTVPMPPTAIPEKPEAGKYTFTQSVLDIYHLLNQ